MRGISVAFGAACLAVHLAAFSQPYKCTDSKGNVTFQQSACTSQKSGPKDEKEAQQVSEREFEAILEKSRTNPEGKLCVDYGRPLERLTHDQRFRLVKHCDALGANRINDNKSRTPESGQSVAERHREASKRWDEYMRMQKDELDKRPMPKEALNQGVAVAPKPKTPAIGMTADAVLDIWGKPEKINRTTTARGVKEQWVYGRIHRSYVYVDNGIVTGIQESK